MPEARIAERRWSWRWLFDGWLYWGPAGIVTGALITLVLVLGGVAVAVGGMLVPPSPEPVALFPLVLVLWGLQFVPMLGLGYLHTISREGRAPVRVPFLRPTRVPHPPVFHPPLRPAWWYRMLGWSLVATAPIGPILAAASLLLPEDGSGFLFAMFLAACWVAVNIGHANIAFRVARWADEGALMPGPPLSRP
jgi:hypothetical protein